MEETVGTYFLTRVQTYSAKKVKNVDVGMLTFDLQPEYSLKRTGEDLSEHDGLEWIRLQCPNCVEIHKFVPIATIVNKKDFDWLTYKDFHTLAKCPSCNDIVYIQCWEYDDDRDYCFQYEMHSPRVSFLNLDSRLDLDQMNPLLRELEACYGAGAYRATSMLAKKNN